MSESDREREQRRRAAEIVSRAMPDVARLAQEIVRNQINIPDISKFYSQQYGRMFEQIRRTVRERAIPKIEFQKFKLDIPALKLDYSTLFPDLAEMQRPLLEGLKPSLDVVQSLQYSQFASILESVSAAARAALPPNWRDEDIVIPEDLEALLLDEGLALAWVPPPETVRKLFEATSAQERRRILGGRWRIITGDCIRQLEGIQAAPLAEYVEFALSAARTLLGNNARPAQALSANLLDTILRQNFDNESRKTITGQRTRMDIDDYPLRVAIVVGGIWGSFGEFRADKDDLIPRKFSRHGSVHGVSRRQYSRVNSLIALMHVVSLLKLLEIDLAK